VGEETSRSALLAPGHSQSWAAPGAFWTLAKSVFQKDPALRFRFSSDPQFWRWAMKFLANCTPGNYQANTLRVLRCMMAGLSELRALSADTGVSYGGNDAGILYLFGPPTPLRERHGDWALLREHGLKPRMPTPSDALLSAGARACKHLIGRLLSRMKALATPSCSPAAWPSTAAAWGLALRSTPRCAPSSAMADWCMPFIRTRVRFPAMPI
jgi:hypothetical protein